MLNAFLILLANLASSPATPIVDIVPTIDEKGQFEIYLKATRQAHVSVSASQGAISLRCDEERLDDGWSSFSASLPIMEKSTWVGPVDVYSIGRPT